MITCELLKGGKTHRHTTTEYLENPGGSDGKVSAYNAGDLGSVPGSGRSPGEGNGNPLQYSCPTPKKGLKEIWASLVAQMVKRLPTMREAQV